MKTRTILFVVLIAFASSTFAQRRNGRRTYTIEEQETITRTLNFSASKETKTLEVDAIAGSIRVTGYDGTTVEMVARKLMRADSPGDIRTAKDKHTLDIQDKADKISIFVDQPGHHRSNPRGYSDDGYRNYEVSFDFELRVPRTANIDLGIVGGDIHVEGMRGDFDVSNVGGEIAMTGLSGSGTVSSVGGSIDAKFDGNPKNNTSFKTVGGSIDVTFPRNLSADLRFKTFSAAVYTDFPTTPLSNTFRSRDQFQSARVGNGGPTLTFDGFSDNIKIRQAK